MTTLPSLFLAHGAPDLLLGEHPAKDFLTELGEHLPRPAGIVVISAHWEARQFAVTSAPAPATVHDFTGWPAPLYELLYPARTSAALVREVCSLAQAAGLACDEDPRRGYDHGAWVPLMLTHPGADVPVVQLALERGGDPARHFALGRALAPLRARGVLVAASGASVHNLGALAPEGSPAPEWALAFDDWLTHSLERRDLDALLAFPATPPQARQAHPTSEHLTPLFVAMGAGWEGGRTALLHASYSYGSIGMACHAFGGVELDTLTGRAAA